MVTFTRDIEHKKDTNMGMVGIYTHRNVQPMHAQCIMYREYTGKSPTCHMVVTYLNRKHRLRHLILPQTRNGLSPSTEKRGQRMGGSTYVTLLVTA